MNLFPALPALILSGFAGAFFSSGYKAMAQLDHRYKPFVSLYSLAFSLFTAIGVLLIRGTLADSMLWLFGIPHGVVTCLAILFYAGIIGNVRLSISWTIIQFSILIPLAVSLIFFETDLNLLAVAGCAFMVLAIIIFSLGKKGASPAEESPRLTFKNGLLLFTSSLFTGIAFTIPMIYLKAAERSQPLSLLFISAIASLLTSLWFVRKEDWSYIMSDWRIAGIPTAMGFLQMANWSLLMIGLQGIGGSVAYSLNGVVGLVCVYGISFSFFKERVSPIEKIGILVSIIAILLMTASLYANAP